MAGNMTTVPKPSSLASGLTCKYDAWNHLVEVKEGATVVAVYEYDGLARRVKKHVDSESPAQSRRDRCLRALLLQPGLAGA